MKRCWFHQFALAWYRDSGAPAPRWAERHSRSCPKCRQFQQDQTAVITALRAGAAAHRPEFPLFVHARTMARLDRQAAPGPHFASGIPWIRALIIPAVSVALLAAIW